jgi:hypothetical protein
MKYTVIKHFLDGSLKGMVIEVLTNVDFSSSVGCILGGGSTGPKYKVLACLLND